MQLKNRLYFSIAGDALLSLSSGTAFALIDNPFARTACAVVFIVSALGLYFGIRFLKNASAAEEE